MIRSANPRHVRHHRLRRRVNKEMFSSTYLLNTSEFWAEDSVGVVSRHESNSMSLYRVVQLNLTPENLLFFNLGRQVE